jgi:hypothetical protein
MVFSQIDDQQLLGQHDTRQTAQHDPHTAAAHTTKENRKLKTVQNKKRNSSYLLDPYITDLQRVPIAGYMFVPKNPQDQCVHMSTLPPSSHPVFHHNTR